MGPTHPKPHLVVRSHEREHSLERRVDWSPYQVVPLEPSLTRLRDEDTTWEAVADGIAAARDVLHMWMKVVLDETGRGSGGWRLG